MAVDKGTGSRASRPKAKPAKRAARPRLVRGESAADKVPSPEVQARVAEGKRSRAYQDKLRTEAGQRGLIGVERAREPERYRSDVARQVRDPSIADRAAGALFRGSAAGLGYGSMLTIPGAMLWSADAMIPEGPRRGKPPTGMDAVNAALAHIGGLQGRGPSRGAAESPRIGPKTVEEHLVDSLPEAQKLRVKQEAGYAKEKGKRIAAADEAYEAAGGGLEGYKASLRELRGELPKLRFGALEDLNPATRDRLLDYIAAHPDLANRRWDVKSAQRALLNVVEGRVPTRGDIKWLQKMFGTETAVEVVQNTPMSKKAVEGLLNVLNVPRALKSSMDLSAPFRQGLVLGARHPVLWARAWKPMLKSFKSEGAYEAEMLSIYSRRNAELYDDAKLALTDLEGSFLAREEMFGSRLAELVPGVRMSGRAYTVFLNRLRADAFDYYVDTARANGKEFNTQELRAVARWVNNATGRGGGDNKAFRDSLNGLNILLFSPRLMASRVNLLNPYFYGKLYHQNPVAGRAAIRGATQLAGAVSLTLWLARLGGADVEVDPRSSDFGKVKIGDTRIDPAGGFTQYVTFGSRQITGQTKTEDGVEELGSDFGQRSQADVILRFGRSKAAPIPAYLWDQREGLTFDYKPFDPWTQAGWLFAPIGFQQVWDTYHEAGPRPAAAGFGLNFVGVGAQTYGQNPPKERERKYEPRGRPGSDSGAGRRARRPGSSSGGNSARRPD